MNDNALCYTIILILGIVVLCPEAELYIASTGEGYLGRDKLVSVGGRRYEHGLCGIVVVEPVFGEGTEKVPIFKN